LDYLADHWQTKNIKKEITVSSRDSARAEFLRAIKCHAPAVLSSLESDVMPLYVAINSPEPVSENIIEFDLAMLPEQLAEMSRVEFVGDECREKEYVASLHVLYQPNARFELALCKWGRCYHLTEQWIFSEALKTLDLWYRSGATGDWTCASQGYAPDVEMYDEQQAFRFTFEPWDAAVDTRPSYKDKAGKAFKAWLDDYCERMEEAHDGGLKAYDSRKSNHFVWLIEHQINGLRYEDIAQKYQDKKGLDLRLISEAVTRLAKMIGLTLRPARRRSANL
jgi:hypothetical protein